MPTECLYLRCTSRLKTQVITYILDSAEVDRGHCRVHLVSVAPHDPANSNKPHTMYGMQSIR